MAWFKAALICACVSWPALSHAGTGEEVPARREVALILSAFAARHDAQEAIAAYQRVLDKYPDYLPARLGLGLMLMSIQRWSDAQSELIRVVKESKGGRLLRAAQIELAKVEYAIAQDGNVEHKLRRDYDELVRQARMHLTLRQVAAASDLAFAARSRLDERWEAYAVLGDAALVAGQPDKAAQLYAAAAERAASPYRDRLQSAVMELVTKKGAMVSEQAEGR